MSNDGRIKRGSKAPRVTVNVSQDVIDVATRRDSSHCMIADAVKLAVPNASAISVDLASVRWTDRSKGLRYIYLTPRIGQLNLLRFDQGDVDIEPFKFELRGATVIRANTKKQSDVVPKRARLRVQEATVETGKGDSPQRVGGAAPPVGPLSNSPKVRVGRRRQFGLRALSR